MFISLNNLLVRNKEKCLFNNLQADCGIPTHVGVTKSLQKPFTILNSTELYTTETYICSYKKGRNLTLHK